MTVLGVLSFVVAVAGLGGTWYFYRKGRREKAPVWAWETYSAFGGGLPSRFKLVFGSQEVQRVSVTRIVFWNSGRETIRETDIAEPLQFTFPEGCQVLEVEQESVSRPQIAMVSELSPDHVRLKFTFLDFNDGAAILVRHNGDSSTKPAARGTIVGVPRGIRLLGRIRDFRRKPPSKVRIAVSVLTWLGALGYAFAVLLLVTGFLKNSETSPMAKFQLVSLVLLLFLLFLTDALVISRDVFRRGLPTWMLKV